MRCVLAFALLFAAGCAPEEEPDYFPLTEGARRFMRVSSRKVVDSDTTEQTEVRMTAYVHGEKEVPELGKVWVVESPRDSGPPTYSYFRREPEAVIQVVPIAGREPLEVRYLSLPLSKGRNWYDTEEQREWFEVVTRETVKVEAGTFPDCYKVAIVSTGVDWAMHQWYAPDVGQVKWESRAAWTKDGVKHELVRKAELVRYEVPAE